ncbi:MAG: 50S ribosomal protein L4 [Bacteroidales bacterium]|jgi:large subunit ribosomal protein L4|nr:50S ribosomal protein L4 [Bacteroidales bacterium]NLM91790.1 50S ribosomal protein L4 [Bacteroidales bacterium]
MELTVYNIDGTKTARTVVLNDGIFGVEPNDHAIYLDVKQYLANQRQGTHKSKERNEIAGSTRKLHRQKGTGGSRKGDIKSPLFRGGGRIFGPVPRDYSFKVNKKVKRLARKSALTYKAKDNNIMVLETFKMDEPRTKNYLEILKKFNLENKKSLLVVPEVDRNLVLSSRNIPKAKVALASDLNTYMILNADHLLLVESSLPEVENILLD